MDRNAKCLEGPHVLYVVDQDGAAYFYCLVPECQLYCQPYRCFGSPVNEELREDAWKSSRRELMRTPQRKPPPAMPAPASGATNQET